MKVESVGQARSPAPLLTSAILASYSVDMLRQTSSALARHARSTRSFHLAWMRECQPAHTFLFSCRRWCCSASLPRWTWPRQGGQTHHGVINWALRSNIILIKTLNKP